MDTPQSPKIPFYVQRPFGEKLNASFDFIRENWKVMLKYITYLILPVCLLQALTMNSVVGQYMGWAMDGAGEMLFEGMGMNFFVSYGFTVLLSIIGGLLMTSLIYALVKLYNDREERLNGITFKDIRPLLFRNMGRLFLLGLLLMVFTIFVSFVAGVLVAISGYTMIIALPIFIAVFVALALWPSIYLFEQIGIGDSFSKAFRMGFATWGGVFGVLFIMVVIASILQGVLTIPWYVAIAVKALFVYSSEPVEGMSQSSLILYNTVVYILGIIQVYGAYLSMIFTIIGLSYQYAHASEKLDSITVESEIDNFENL